MRRVQFIDPRLRQGTRTKSPHGAQLKGRGGRVKTSRCQDAFMGPDPRIRARPSAWPCGGLLPHDHGERMDNQDR
jgi:hypothetical protein